MLCGICWRAPWPIQPAAAGYMALGALHNLCGLGTVASLSVGAPLSSCRSCESFTVRRVGVRGGHLPGVQAGPLHQSILALGSCSSGREELWPLFSRPWELGSPGGPPGLSGTSSGQTLVGTGEGEKAAVRAPLRTRPPSLPQPVPPSPSHCS